MPSYEELEFNVPETNPLDDINAFLMIGNAEHFLKEHYRLQNPPRMQKITSFITEIIRQCPALWMLSPVRFIPDNHKISLPYPDEKDWYAST